MRPETGRNASFDKIIKMMEEDFTSPINIVETGCIRSINPNSKFGDGWSTINWEYYAKNTNSRVFVVDISQDNIGNAKQIVPESEYVKYTVSDSIEYLKNFDKTIDVLYLDSYDYSGTEENIARCHNHSLNEVKAAWDKLNPHCYILIDDVYNETFDGKGKLSIPYLMENGFELVYQMDSQALLKR
jgi:hypothetical protein